MVRYNSAERKESGKHTRYLNKNYNQYFSFYKFQRGVIAQCTSSLGFARDSTACCQII